MMVTLRPGILLCRSRAVGLEVCWWPQTHTLEESFATGSAPALESHLLGRNRLEKSLPLLPAVREEPGCPNQPEQSTRPEQAENERWWALQDSNLRPPPCKGDALAAAPSAQPPSPYPVRHALTTCQTFPVRSRRVQLIDFRRRGWQRRRAHPQQPPTGRNRPVDGRDDKQPVTNGTQFLPDHRHFPGRQVMGPSRASRHRCQTNLCGAAAARPRAGPGSATEAARILPGTWSDCTLRRRRTG
jgi:hypothetical protein